MNDWLNVSEDWQPHQKAPKDGTPILISGGGTIGVFHWEDRATQLGKSRGGKLMPACWRGVYFLTYLNPVIEHKPDGPATPMEHRIIQVDGLDEPFFWKPLPAQPVETTPKKGAGE